MEEEYYRFPKENLPEFIRRLKRNYQVWLPVKKNGLIDFEPDADVSQAELEYQQSHLGIKKIFFPAQETLFTIQKGQPEIPKIKKPAAVIGAHPVDLIGIQRLDESFAQAPADFYWQRQRKNSLLIGVTPLESHPYFSGSLDDYSLIFDLFFHRQAKTYYLVETGSKKGETLVKNGLFAKTSQKPNLKTVAHQPDAILSDPLKVSQIIEKSRGSKIWKKLGKICLNCGICSYVCPLCYCFTMSDKIAADGQSCRRCRRWDACTLASFSQISGGHNFRPLPEDRLYNWFYHKFVRAPGERGKIDCIGCHRCTDFCPAGIDFRQVIQQLAREQKVK